MIALTAQPQPNSFRTGPDERGRFGIYGGRFVAETLMPLILQLEAEYRSAKDDPAFQAEMGSYRTHYIGRPSPLYFAERLTEHLGGAKVYLKREELNHTGSHKVNNVLGQILLARHMYRRDLPPDPPHPMIRNFCNTWLPPTNPNACLMLNSKCRRPGAGHRGPLGWRGPESDRRAQARDPGAIGQVLMPTRHAT